MRKAELLTRCVVHWSERVVELGGALWRRSRDCPTTAFSRCAVRAMLNDKVK